jgi:hypothetical protein
VVTKIDQLDARRLAKCVDRFFSRWFVQDHRFHPFCDAMPLPALLSKRAKSVKISDALARSGSVRINSGECERILTVSMKNKGGWHLPCKRTFRPQDAAHTTPLSQKPFGKPKGFFISRADFSGVCPRRPFKSVGCGARGAAIESSLPRQSSSKGDFAEYREGIS